MFYSFSGLISTALEFNFNDFFLGSSLITGAFLGSTSGSLRVSGSLLISLLGSSFLSSLGF